MEDQQQTQEEQTQEEQTQEESQQTQSSNLFDTSDLFTIKKELENLSNKLTLIYDLVSSDPPSQEESTQVTKDDEEESEKEEDLAKYNEDDVINILDL